MQKKTIVLDTSAFIGGFDPFAAPEKQFTVPEVENELNAGSMPWMPFTTAIENRKVTIMKLQDSFFQEI